MKIIGLALIKSLQYLYILYIYILVGCAFLKRGLWHEWSGSENQLHPVAGGFLVAQMAKNLPTMQETQV